MKEIIVINKHEFFQLMSCLPIPMFKDENSEKEIIEGRKFVLFGKERRIEQIPETWEELKELCIEMGKYVFTEGYKTEYIVVKYKYFTADGKIFDYDWRCFADNLTPKRQWQIIKALVEE